MEEPKVTLGLSDTLAVDRTRLAAERTLMGWIRTSFAMMTFGFTIFKVMQELRLFSANTLGSSPQGTRELGMALAGLGTFALLIACFQHWRYVRRLKRISPIVPFDLALAVASLVVCLGFSILGGLALRIGPFG